jgi:hypothetical protein
MLGIRRQIALSLRWRRLLGRWCVTRHAKPLDSQMNLQLVDAKKTVIPDSKRRELSLALVELLVGAAQSNNRQQDGGGDELEADR